ncbi:hypothetical protein ACVW0P_004152 [Mucilaginibacter sp. UYNi724]
MKAMYIVVIVVIVILGALIYMLVTRSDDKREAALYKKQTENPYMGLRKQVLSLKPQDLKLNISPDKETAFCVVLEFGTNDGAATIISLLTGDASMYTSSGGGIIGGASHENVNKAAIAFVSSAQNYFTKMGPESMEIPKPNHIKFHILTNKGHYSFEGLESDITAEKSEWAEIFYKGNDVITQLRLINEK